MVYPLFSFSFCLHKPAVFIMEKVNLCKKFILWENSFDMFIFTTKHICNILLHIIIIIIVWNGSLYRLLVCYIPCHNCLVLLVERQITVKCAQVWHVSEVVDWFQFTAFPLLLICHCIFDGIKNSKFLGTEESKINSGLSFLFDNIQTCKIYKYFRTYCNVYKHNWSHILVLVWCTLWCTCYN